MGVYETSAAATLSHLLDNLLGALLGSICGPT